MFYGWELGVFGPPASASKQPPNNYNLPPPLATRKPVHPTRSTPMYRNFKLNFVRSLLFTTICEVRVTQTKTKPDILYTAVRWVLLVCLGCLPVDFESMVGWP